MPQSTAGLVNLGNQYAPLATGINPSTRLPTDGLPGMGSGSPFAAMAGMAVTPHMYRAFGQVGMVPMGVGHDQNVYDRIVAQQFTQAQTEAIRQAAEGDRRGVMQTIRGMAALTGTPYGGEQRRAAAALTNRITSFAPFMAMAMPDVMDQLGGLRGSSAVLASRMMDAGRYRVDPVTGRMGMSADTAGLAARDIHADLFSLDNMRQMKGITAGQAGAMFHELQHRGMVATAATEAGYGGYRGDDPRSSAFRAVSEMGMTRPAELIRAAKNVGVDLKDKLSGGDLDKLMGDTSVSDRVRSYDTERIKKTIKGYASMVSSMRDIFGDMGRPNAPMSEIMAGLEALTGGSLSQLDPARAGAMARQTYNLSKQTGVTLDNALMIQQHASARGEQLGLEPIFGVQAAQGGLAFGGAYRAQGHGAHTAWGKMNADQLTQLDVNLRQQAAASPVANQLAAAIRLSRATGGFEAGSDAARMIEAVTKTGTHEWQDANGKIRNVAELTPSDLARMLTDAKAKGGKASGLTMDDVYAAVGQTDANREDISRYGLQHTVRRAQPAELQQFIGHRMIETLSTRLSAKLTADGMDGDKAFKQSQEAAEKIGQSASRRIFGLSSETMAKDDRRDEAIGRIVEEELTAAGHGDMLKNMSPDEKARFLRQTANRFVGHTDRALKGSRFAAQGNLTNVHAANNATVLDETDRQSMQSAHRTSLQEAMSGLGQGSILSRLVDAIQHARPGDEQAAMKAIASTLGGVKKDDINKALLPVMQDVVAKKKAVEDLQGQLVRETDPTKKAGLTEQLRKAHDELTKQVGGLAKLGEEHGAFAVPALTAEDTERFRQTSGGAITAQNDLVGLRGNFGQWVTPAQLAAGRARMGRSDANDGEVREFVREERRRTPWRATQAQIAELKKQFPQATDDEVRELANSRQRARRLGIDESEFSGKGTARAELDAIGEAFYKRTQLSMTVSDDDRAAHRAEHKDDKGPTDEQMGRFQAGHPELQGKSKDEVLRAMTDVRILQTRQEGHRRRFAAFWNSEEGEAFRNSTDEASQDVETVAAKLTTSPEMLHRYGTEAVDVSKKLREGQQRLETLAMYHSRGDVARLLANDVNVDISTPAGQRTMERIRKEINAIQSYRTETAAGLQKREGLPGKQILRTDEQEAKRLQELGKKDGRPDVDAKAVGLYRKLSAEDEKDLVDGDPAKIKALADKLKVSEADLLPVKEVSTRLSDLQKQAVQEENISPLAAVKKVVAELGVATGDETTTAQRQLADAAGSTRGRWMLREFGASAKTIGSAVDRKAGGRKGVEGKEDLRRAYADAMTKQDDKKLDEFKKAYGFDESTDAGKQDWDKFEEAMRFQQHTGLLRHDGKEDTLLKTFNQAMQGGLGRPETDGPGANMRSQRIEGDLTIHWKGDHGVGTICAVGRDHLVNPA